MIYRSLHQKPLGEYTLKDVILRGRYHQESSRKFIYHYTSPEGLKGILTSKSFHFTDCQYLNDIKERVNINEDICRFWDNNHHSYKSEFCDLLSDIRVNEFEDAEYAYSESDKKYGYPETLSRYFVFSTSMRRDSLNMWKYYAKNNTYNGYCIGIEKGSLKILVGE